MTMPETVPPHSLEAEQALLGAMLLDAAAVPVAKAVLDAGAFYRTAHQRLFSLLTDLYAVHGAVDPIVVREEMARRGLSEEIGGEGGLADLMGAVGSPAQAEHYARIVQEKALRRSLIQMGKQVTSQAQGGDEVADVLRRTQDCLGAIGSAALNVGVPAERILRFRTAAEIARETPAEVGWLAKPLLPVGAIVSLEGPPKSAGKTTFATHMVAKVLDGFPFLGQLTRQTPVVYLTEQSPNTFREALRRPGLLGREDLHVLYWHEALGVPWRAVVCQAVRKCKEVGAHLLIVDTITPFAAIQGDGENSAGHAMEAVKPLLEATASGLSILVIRHERKGGGAVGESGRGSSAFAGAVDVVLSLRRAEGQTRPSVRVIHALSRYDETPDTLVIELTPEGYVSLGSETVIAVPDARKAILKSLPTSEEQAMPLKDLQKILPDGVKRTTAQEALEALVEEGSVLRTGNGRKGSAYRYWRKGIHSAATPTLRAAESNGGGR